jgi:manganese/zinc/iron transport system substrate-binding protein
MIAAFPAFAQEATSEPLPGCSEPGIHAVATIGMIADVVSVVGGNCVEVTAMMGPGVDPHLYTATEGDVELLFDAHIIFYGGLHLEARMTDVFEQVRDGLGKPTIPVSESIPEDLILTSPQYNAPDPHVWMDVQLWMIAAEAIRDSLSDYLPEQAEYFAQNADTYLVEMEELDEYVREQIERIPEEQRVLVTAHDAFQYYSRAYGIEVHAPQGITTEAEVGVQDIRETIDLLVERHIPTIFVESSVSPDVVEAIVEGARDRGLEVTIGGSLFSDAMGEEGTPDGTYLGMIRHNTDTIVAGLLGEAEE